MEEGAPEKKDIKVLQQNPPTLITLDTRSLIMPSSPRWPLKPALVQHYSRYKMAINTILAPRSCTYLRSSGYNYIPPYSKSPARPTPPNGNQLSPSLKLSASQVVPLTRSQPNKILTSARLRLTPPIPRLHVPQNGREHLSRIMAIKFKAPIQTMGLYWERGDGDLGTYGWRRRSVRIVGVVIVQ